MRVVFDTKTRRPGCALLQALYGGNVPSMMFGVKFPVETWMLAPTESMRTYEVTEEELDQLAELSKLVVGYKTPASTSS
jgi:hypothetical protein